MELQTRNNSTIYFSGASCQLLEQSQGMAPAAAGAEMPGGIRPQEDGGNCMPEVSLPSMIGVAGNKASLLFMSLQR